MKDILLTQIPKQELIDEIASKVTAALKAKQNTIPEVELIKPKEAAKILQVSLPTLISWTNKGLLTAYKMGRRKYYKKAELISSLAKN